MKLRLFTILGSVALLTLPIFGRAEIVIAGNGIEMIPPVVADFDSMQARVTGPQGEVYRETSRGEILIWRCDGCADGAYAVEARTAITTGATNEEGTAILGVGKVEGMRFSVQEGVVIPGEGKPSPKSETALSPFRRVVDTMLDWLFPSAHAADLFASSVIPEVYFEDTDSPFVGNEFSLRCDGGTGTDNSCMFWDRENSFQTMWQVDSNPSRIEFGIGTSAPSEALHIATPQVPYILLDSPSTDLRIGGSDDVTFSFTTNNYGPTGNILTLENDESAGFYPGLGVWHDNPDVPLHVGSHDGQSAGLTVENTLLSPAGDVSMFRLINPGTNILRFVLNAGGSRWTFDNDPNLNSSSGVFSGQFRVAKVGTGLVEFSVDGFGNGRFRGVSYALFHQNTSSRALKTGFQPVDHQQVLEQLTEMPIMRWEYLDQEGTPHVGPVAEDFKQVFGLGDGEHIATVDADGIALAAIQGLHQIVEEQQREIEALKQENETLRNQSAVQVESLVARLEALEIAGKRRQ